MFNTKVRYKRVFPIVDKIYIGELIVCNDYIYFCSDDLNGIEIPKEYKNGYKYSFRICKVNRWDIHKERFLPLTTNNLKYRDVNHDPTKQINTVQKILCYW